MTSALVVVDLQVGTTSAETAHPIGDVVARAASLAAAYRATGHPVVLASVDGTPPGRTTYSGGAQHWPEPFATLLPDLEQHPADLLAPRRTWSAFVGTDLHERLTARGVTQVVVVGVATNFGVESTARSAYDLGYDVVVVGDAVTDRSAAAHEHVVERVLPALGRVESTSDVLSWVGAGR